jgi:hypothetical protein
MLAAYGIDVRDPSVTTRRVHVLLSRLPPRGRELGQPWTPEAELLAGLIDHIAYLTYVVLRLGGSTPERPKPVWRPPRGSPWLPAGGPAEQRQEQRPERPSWGAAIAQIAAMPGVVVRDG